MPVLQDDLEVASPTLEQRWKANEVAERLLFGGGMKRGEYQYIQAAEDIWPCEILTVDEYSVGKRWEGSGSVSGIAFCVISKNNYGWIQVVRRERTLFESSSVAGI